MLTDAALLLMVDIQGRGPTPVAQLEVVFAFKVSLPALPC